MTKYLSRMFVCTERTTLRIGVYECGNEATRIVERIQHDVVLEKRYMCENHADEWMKDKR